MKNIKKPVSRGGDRLQDANRAARRAWLGFFEGGIKTVPGSPESIGVSATDFHLASNQNRNSPVERLFNSAGFRR